MTQTDLAIFHHATLGAPKTSTMIKAIDKGFLTTFPRLTSPLIKKHLPPAVETAQGHLDQQRQHLQSTQPSTNNADPDILTEPAEKTNNIMAAVVQQNNHSQGASFGNLTGQYPVPSSEGN